MRGTQGRLKLKLAIVATGKSQREVAAETRGVLTEDRLSQIVCGWIRPRDDEKAALASVLNVPIGTLFDN
jgi:hypothetical protein